MKKKKLIALGLTAIMALSYSGSVFAAGTYYISKLAHNSAYGLVTGSITYTPADENSKYLCEEIIVQCKVGNIYKDYPKKSYGLNATSTTLDKKTGEYSGTLKSGINIGYVKEGNVYQEFGRKDTDF